MANPTHLIFPIPRNKKKFFHRLPLSEESRSVAAAAAPPILFSSSFLFLTGDDQSTSPSKPGGGGAESQRKEANFLFSRKRENWFWRRRRRNGVSLLFLFFRDPLMIPFLFPFPSSPRAFVKADLPETNKKEGRNEILLTESSFRKQTCTATAVRFLKRERVCRIFEPDQACHSKRRIEERVLIKVSLSDLWNKGATGSFVQNF